MEYHNLEEANHEIKRLEQRLIECGYPMEKILEGRANVLASPTSSLKYRQGYAAALRGESYDNYMILSASRQIEDWQQGWCQGQLWLLWKKIKNRSEDS